jgi:hypothetical protein
LGGNSKTSIIATISSDSDSYVETLSTLTFANRAKNIKNKAIINETASGSSALLKELQRELEQVKAQLSCYQSSSAPPSPAGGGSEYPMASGSYVTPYSFFVTNIRGNVSADTSLLHRALERIKYCEENEAKLTKKIESLYDYCERQDCILQSKAFVNRLYIAKLERLKTLKATSGGLVDLDNEARIVEAETEIEALKYQLEHHPQVIKTAAECEELKGWCLYFCSYKSNMSQKLSQVMKNYWDQTCTCTTLKYPKCVSS